MIPTSQRSPPHYPDIEGQGCGSDTNDKTQILRLLLRLSRTLSLRPWLRVKAEAEVQML